MTQLSLADGLTAKRDGLAQVEAHNVRWVERMRAQAKKHARLHGSVCSDDLRRFADMQKDYPIHPNAYGSIFRGPGWAVVGHKMSAWPSCHCREIRIWRYRA